jgi:hypothetical protein
MDNFHAKKQKLNHGNSIGPYTTKHKSAGPLQLWCLTMIDPAKGWLEIRELTNKEAITPANLVEQTWLTRYPIPQISTYD